MLHALSNTHTHRDVEENSKELLVQVWDSNTYLSDELIGEIKINLDVFLRKKGAVKVRSNILVCHC